MDARSTVGLTGLPSIPAPTPVFMMQPPSPTASGQGYAPGFEPYGYDICEGDASSCSSACGTGYETCWHENENFGTRGNWTGCYNPGKGETCCGDLKGKHVSGGVCAGGFYCAENVDQFAGGLFCCKKGLSLEQCNTDVVQTAATQVTRTKSLDPSALRTAGVFSGSPTASVTTSAPAGSGSAGAKSGAGRIKSRGTIAMSMGLLFVLLALGA